MGCQIPAAHKYNLIITFIIVDTIQKSVMDSNSIKLWRSTHLCINLRGHVLDKIIEEKWLRCLTDEFSKECIMERGSGINSLSSSTAIAAGLGHSESRVSRQPTHD